MKPFFDTNIIVYAQQAGPKAERARALLAAGGLISVQVLNEFTNVAVRKQGRDWEAVAEAIEDVLALVAPPIPLTLEMHEVARKLAAVHRLSFYDLESNPSAYLHVRGGLLARLNRPAFYALVELALSGGEEPPFVESMSVRFPLVDAA